MVHWMCTLWGVWTALSVQMGYAWVANAAWLGSRLGIATDLFRLDCCCDPWQYGLHGCSGEPLRAAGVVSSRCPSAGVHWQVLFTGGSCPHSGAWLRGLGVSMQDCVSTSGGVIWARF
jgi:hypothetical protein